MPVQPTSLRHLVRLAFAFTLFQRGVIPEKMTEKDPRLDNEEQDFSRIRCPLCKWQPDKSSRWMCDDCGHPEYFFNGCGTLWNTFDTRGLCPGCAHQWRWTSCLRCYGWSLHEDWYTKEAN